MREAKNAAPAAVAGPVAYRVLRKRHDGEWVTDGRAWCDGVPTQDLVDDIALRSDGWRIEYAFAAPTTSAAPVAHGDALDEVRRAVAAIAVVGHVDGHAVVRRLSVLDMLDRRIAARAQAKEGGA